MQLLYEEDGELKVGAVLAQAPASFQVESPHGRRTKIKAASVLLSFERPAAAELLASAQEFAAGLDVGFLVARLVHGAGSDFLPRLAEAVFGLALLLGLDLAAPGLRACFGLGLAAASGFASLCGFGSITG